MQGVKHARRQYQAARAFGVVPEHIGDKYIEPVGNHHFFKQSPADKLKTGGYIFIAEPVPLVERVGEAVEPAYRALHYLREKREEKRDLAEIVGRPVFAAVDVYKIPRRLKRVIGYSQRHNKVQNRQGNINTRKRRGAVEKVCEKSRILNHEQHSEYNAERKGGNRFFLEGNKAFKLLFFLFFKSFFAKRCRLAYFVKQYSA